MYHNSSMKINMMHIVYYTTWYGYVIRHPRRYNILFSEKLTVYRIIILRCTTNVSSTKSVIKLIFYVTRLYNLYYYIILRKTEKKKNYNFDARARALVCVMTTAAWRRYDGGEGDFCRPCLNLGKRHRVILHFIAIVASSIRRYCYSYCIRYALPRAIYRL